MRTTAHRSLRRSRLDPSMNQAPQVFKGISSLSVMGISLTELHHTGGFLGTVVMKVIATDDDQVNTLNTKIFYSIVEQANTARFFRINSQTGDVTVQRNTLDREASHLTNLKFFFCHLVQNSLHSDTVYTSRQLLSP